MLTWQGKGGEPGGEEGEKGGLEGAKKRLNFVFYFFSFSMIPPFFNFVFIFFYTSLVLAVFNVFISPKIPSF